MSGIDGIRIDEETADRIALAVLKDDYLLVRENIKNIERHMMVEPNLPAHIDEDYKYDKKLLKAIKRVLSYHMTQIEVAKFIEENK